MHLYQTTVDRLVAQQEIERAASQDPLTGLANRTYFQAHLDQVLAAMEERASSAAALFIDLDRFKTVNDTLGHHVGDAILRTVAKRLRDAVGADDLVGRWGGDEFVVLQGSVRQAASAEELARRIVERLSAPCIIEGREVHVGASVGIAIASATPADAETLLRKADAALFAAKADGRGTWRLYDERMHRSALSRAA
jgi:diguanylate cyclase (GGDEF)-like protein